MKLAITAGFDGSKPAIALCELLSRQGHEIGAVIVVSPWNIKRARQLISKRGKSGLLQAVKKMFPSVSNEHAGREPLSDFLKVREIQERSLKSWCKRREVVYVSVDGLNTNKAIEALTSYAPDAAVYAGGGILRKPFIEAAKRAVLNMHSGPLPEIRGMNAIEWAVLLGHEPAITLHFIDEGIDTGTIIKKVPLLLKANEDVEPLRQRAVVVGIESVICFFEKRENLHDVTSTKNAGVIAGRQCYVMAPVIRELLQKKMFKQY